MRYMTASNLILRFELNEDRLIGST